MPSTKSEKKSKRQEMVLSRSKTISRESGMLLPIVKTTSGCPDFLFTFCERYSDSQETVSSVNKSITQRSESQFTQKSKDNRSKKP